MKSDKKIVDISATKKRIWFMLNIIFTCIYLAWRLLFTIPLEYEMISIVAGVSLFTVEFLGMLEAMVHFYNMNRIENYVLPNVPVERFPNVDIFIATYNEPTEVLYKTVNGCLNMDYPDRNKVHIYLCDDGRRKEVKDLAKRMGVGYFDREDNKHAKAGNLNNALSKTSSPLIVTFDADMIPRHEFLMRTIPYFVDSEMKNEGKEAKEQKHIGFVQTPQVFYNPDLFQFNLFSEARIPNEQDYFYRDIQVSRNKSNSVIYGGSNTILSRAALEDIGGFFTGSITEDYGTGILLQKKKYIGIAINEPLASGLSPTDLKSLIQQRVRWARGVITTNRKMHIWLSPHLKLSQKINYWASCWYWYAPLKRLIYFMSPILYAVFGYVVIKCNLWEILLFWLPMYITSNISLRLLSRNIRTTKWTSIYETVIFPYLLIPVVLETFGITMKKFKVTNKSKAENEKGKNLPYLIPFLLLVFLSVIGIANCLRIILVSGNMGPIVVLFWLIANLFTLLMAMFFVMGRNLLRGSERARVEEKCRLHTTHGIYTAMTTDMSETGVAVLIDNPISYKDNEIIDIDIWTDRYSCEVKGQIVHVREGKKKWRYAFRIVEQGKRYDQYLQILYDRIPTLPQNLDSSSGIFDDLRINVHRRTTKPFYQKRKLPRMEMLVYLPDNNGKRWMIKDFNYRYVSIKTEDKPEVIQLVVNEQLGVKLHGVYEKTIEQDLQLYKVINFDELYENEEKHRTLEEWVFGVLGEETYITMDANMEAAAAVETLVSLESVNSTDNTDDALSKEDNGVKEKEFNEMDYL